MRNLQRYTQNESFDNQGGGGGQFGPEIQFDTKGVEFGPWIRRFIAQVKRNWFIPYAAMSMKGHVVITFNVHKDGSITDLMVLIEIGNIADLRNCQPPPSWAGGGTADLQWTEPCGEISQPDIA